MFGSEVFSFLGHTATAVGALVLSSGGLVGVAWLVFKWFGERWMNARFEQRLAVYKHEQEKELEHLRFRINSLMDRATKLHQHEFEAIPEAWGLLIEAHSSVRSFIAAFQQYPDVDRMSEDELDHFLTDSPLAPWQQAELRAAPRKLEYYRSAIFFHRLNRCMETWRRCHQFIHKNGIFMPEEIKAKFCEMDSLLFDAVLEHELNETDNIHPRMREKSQALREHGAPLLQALEEEVHKRLWSVQHISAE